MSYFSDSFIDLLKQQRLLLLQKIDAIDTLLKYECDEEIPTEISEKVFNKKDNYLYRNKLSEEIKHIFETSADPLSRWEVFEILRDRAECNSVHFYVDKLFKSGVLVREKFDYRTYKYQLKNKPI
jgi:hypothetical protein